MVGPTRVMDRQVKILVQTFVFLFCNNIQKASVSILFLPLLFDAPLSPSLSLYLSSSLSLPLISVSFYSLSSLPLYIFYISLSLSISHTHTQSLSLSSKSALSSLSLLSLLYLFSLFSISPLVSPSLTLAFFISRSFLPSKLNASNESETASHAI
jgi:hypothetical protein